jgi:hypothetical protein
MNFDQEQAPFHRFDVDDSQTTTAIYDSEPRSSSENVSSLPPVDGGKQAWLFLAGATVIEILVWGLPFSVGVLREYWSRELFPTEIYHAETMLTLAATL